MWITLPDGSEMGPIFQFESKSYFARPSIQRSIARLASCNYIVIGMLQYVIRVTVNSIMYDISFTYIYIDI